MNLRLPLTGERVSLADAGDGRVAVTRLRDGKDIGFARLEEQGRELVVRALCLDEAQRSFGCGSEAGHLLVDGAERAGFERMRAWAPPDLGLAVYFWIRMGFRPLHGEGPEGGIWFERRVD